MAGNRIKGITIEIGGDTTKLQTALKGVNSEIRNTQSQLKDVSRLLKLDPGNTELLSQKQKLLTMSISETKDKLDTLKLAANQANEALAKGEITKEQYDALQREIIETSESLKSLEKQAINSEVAIQKIALSGEKLKNTGDKISDAGKKLMPVTGVVTALGTAAVKTASDFDSAMSKVASVSGATGKELDALREKAREMGEKTQFSASEAAEAMNYMAMAGWKTADMISGIDGIMNLAAASGESLAVTSDIVTDALTAFGLTAADSGKFADILAAASSNANTNVLMMGETFKYCAPVAGALGFSVEDTAEAIGLMANAGIKSSQAGTSLRTILTSLNGELKLSGKKIGDLVIQTKNADGSMRDLGDILFDLRIAFDLMTESEAASAAEALVGKNAMSGFLAIMNAAPADIEKLNTAINNASGTAKNMADIMLDNLGGQFTILKSQLEELAISFGELLMPVIRSAVGILQSLVDKLNSMDEGTKRVVLGFSLFMAVLGPILIITGKLITAVGTIMTVVPKVVAAIKGVKAAFAALSAVMAANPIGIVIAAITALVAAFLYLWNNCEGFRVFWISLFEKIKEIAVGVLSFLSEFIVTTFDNIKNTATNIWNNILLVISTVLTNIKNGISTSLDTVKSIWNTSWEYIKTKVSEIWENIKGIISYMFEGIKENITNIKDTIVNGIGEAVDFIKELPKKALNWGRDFINGFIDGIKEKISAVKEAVMDVADSVSEFLHFSRPDKGPLKYYESWMPDFIKGLTKGIENNKSLLINSVSGMAKDMNSVINGRSLNSTINLSNHSYLSLDGKVIADAVDERLGILI